MLIKTEHLLDYCQGCQTNMLRCKTCDNNCCNGGYGEVDGEVCIDCPDAYAVQKAYWDDPDSVDFVKQKVK